MANKWYRVHQGWVKEADVARRAEAEARHREQAAGHTARTLARDLLSYPSKGMSHAWETQARKKAITALNETPPARERLGDVSPLPFGMSSATPLAIDSSTVESGKAASSQPFSSSRMSEQ